jgi:hypothetical protein
MWEFDLPGSLSFRPGDGEAVWLSLGSVPLCFDPRGGVTVGVSGGLGVYEGDWEWEPEE